MKRFVLVALAVMALAVMALAVTVAAAGLEAGGRADKTAALGRWAAILDVQSWPAPARPGHGFAEGQRITSEQGQM